MCQRDPTIRADGSVRAFAHILQPENVVEWGERYAVYVKSDDEVLLVGFVLVLDDVPAATDVNQVCIGAVTAYQDVHSIVRAATIENVTAGGAARRRGTFALAIQFVGACSTFEPV